MKKWWDDEGMMVEEMQVVEVVMGMVKVVMGMVKVAMGMVKLVEGMAWVYLLNLMRWQIQR